MAIPKKQSDTWREALKIVSGCPICSSAYVHDSAKLFAKNESASMVHLTCPSCKSFFVAMIVLMGTGLSSVGMVTDLSFEDLRRLNQAAPITIDEAIEGYQYFQKTAFADTLNHKS